MEASQPAYRAGALCRDLTLSLIPNAKLDFWGLARLARSHGCSGEISVGGMKISPYEHSIPATETNMPPLLMPIAHCSRHRASSGDSASSLLENRSVRKNEGKLNCISFYEILLAILLCTIVNVRVLHNVV